MSKIAEVTLMRKIVKPLIYRKGGGCVHEHLVLFRDLRSLTTRGPICYHSEANYSEPHYAREHIIPNKHDVL